MKLPWLKSTYGSYLTQREIWSLYSDLKDLIALVPRCLLNITKPSPAVLEEAPGTSKHIHLNAAQFAGGLCLQYSSSAFRQYTFP